MNCIHCMTANTDNLTELFSTFRGYKGKITPDNEDACKIYAENFRVKTLQAKAILEKGEALPVELIQYQGKIEITAEGLIIKKGKMVYTEIRINASIDKVWNVFTEFEKYPEWNPFIKSL